MARELHFTFGRIVLGNFFDIYSLLLIMQRLIINKIQYYISMMTIFILCAFTTRQKAHLEKRTF